MTIPQITVILGGCNMVQGLLLVDDLDLFSSLHLSLFSHVELHIPPLNFFCLVSPKFLLNLKNHTSISQISTKAQVVILIMLVSYSCLNLLLLVSGFYLAFVYLHSSMGM